MKIVITDGYALNPGEFSWDVFSEFGQVIHYDRTPDALAAQRIGDADIILINKTVITGQVMDACPNLKLICVMATGYNVVDCDAAKQRGIIVCNVPGYGTASVAQFTFALLLELCHRVGLHNHSVHKGDWCNSPDFCYWLSAQTELAGKTMGIIGFGRIGQAVGRLARAFGMKVLTYNRSRSAVGQTIAEYVELDTLLSRSDVISLHCPLTPQTKEIINAETIGKMKDGAILINTARGPLLHEAAVAEALRSGKLRCAAVDVITQEPMVDDNPLLHAPNCIITPHMAWAPVESRQRIVECTVSNIHAFLKGMPENVVNN